LSLARAHTTLHLEKGVLIEGGKSKTGGSAGVPHEIQPLDLANLFRKKGSLILTIGSFAIALVLSRFLRW